MHHPFWPSFMLLLDAAMAVAFVLYLTVLLMVA